MGQLGTGLATILRQKYGKDNVIMSDILKPSKEVVEAGNLLTPVNIILYILNYNDAILKRIMSSKDRIFLPISWTLNVFKKWLLTTALIGSFTLALC